MEKNLYKTAAGLAIFTIAYNIIEGLVSIWFGLQDETLTLLGFGLDSFIEVMSGIGIAVMILRIQQNPDGPKSKFEITALKITGTAFYLLSAGLLAGIVKSGQPSQTRNHALGSHNIPGFNCCYGLAYECKEESRPAVKFRTNYC